MKQCVFVQAFIVTLLLSSLWGANPISPVKRFGGAQLVNPHRLIASNGEIYVIEPKLSRIMTYTASGEYKMSIGSAGEGPLQFQALSFCQINHDLIYCYDGMSRRISVVSQKDKKFLRYILITNTVYGQPPTQMIITPDETIIMFNNGMVKEHTLIGLYDRKGRLIRRILNAYPAYQSIDEFEDELKKGRKSRVDFYKNAGNITFANGKIYYVNFIENHVTEISLTGKVLNQIPIPLPSHEKTLRFRMIRGPLGNTSVTENQLNYDLKSINNTIYVLCRDNGFSYIFRLVKGKCQEVCRMKEALIKFDIMNDKIYCLEEESDDEDKDSEVLVYDLPPNG